MHLKAEKQKGEGVANKKLFASLTSGSRPSETGGQMFDEIFERPFLGISRKNFCIPQKFHIYLPNFLLPFFSHRPFSCFIWYFSIGGQICSRHRYRGGKSPYFSTKSQYYHCSFCPGGGSNSIANFDGGPWQDLPPTVCRTIRSVRLEG